MKQLNLAICLFLILTLGVSKNLIAQQGAALNFDGYDDRIQLEGLNLTGPFTIEAWVKPTQKIDFLTILSNRFGGLENPGFSFFINNWQTDDGKLVLETQFDSRESLSSVTWGVWQHVAITYDGGNGVNMYINGNNIGTNESNVNLQPSFEPTFIGDFAVYFDNGKFNGTMDEVRVWDYARCQGAIQGQMNCELAGDESGLLAYYNFNQGIAGGNNAGITTLNDLAGADNNGSLQEFALTGASSNWISPGGVVTGNACEAVTDSDTDCDGVEDECDVCAGGDDAVDMNADGLPDCKYPPTLDELLADWKCGNNFNKVLICHNGLTLCVSYSSLAGHLAHGDYIGGCDNANCIEERSNATLTGNQMSSANIYPNPAYGEAWLELSGYGASTIFVRILDLRGSLVQEKQIPEGGNQLIKLDLNTMQSGVYFVRIQQSGLEMKTLKLVVE